MEEETLQDVLEKRWQNDVLLLGKNSNVAPGPPTRTSSGLLASGASPQVRVGDSPRGLQRSLEPFVPCWIWQQRESFDVTGSFNIFKQQTQVSSSENGHHFYHWEAFWNFSLKSGSNSFFNELVTLKLKRIVQRTQEVCLLAIFLQ